MSSPLETPEFENLYLGDIHDDDGPVIDLLFVEKDEPADPSKALIPGAVIPTHRPEAGTRLFPGTYTLTTKDQGQPVQILPPDKRRVSLRVDGYSLATTPGANDYANVSDENGKVVSGTMSWRMRHNKGTGQVDDITNAIWVYAGSNVSDANPFEVTWLAVSK